MSAVNRLWWVLLYGASAYLVFVLCLTAFRLFGPSLEVRLLPPVVSLEARILECRGEDQYLRFFLDKREYINGQGAVLEGLDVRSGLSAMAWRPGDVRDRSPLSAPPGEQERELVIIKGCQRPFEILTKHRSPITGLPLFMEFGPFQQ